MNRKLPTLVIAAALTLAFAASVHSQTCPGSPGCLDPTFGEDGTGKVLIDSGTTSQSLGATKDSAIQQVDQKIVTISSALVNGRWFSRMIRLNSDGSPDLGFGDDGIIDFYWPVMVGSNTYDGYAETIALQTVNGEERIVVAGKGHMKSGKNVIPVLQVGRFLQDGSIDTTFGTNGSVVYNAKQAYEIVIQPYDQKILAFGQGGSLVRLNANGTLDTSFGSGGIVTHGGGRGLAVDTSGRIVVAGQITVGRGRQERSVPTVTRYNPNGTVDTSFGTNGVAKADFGVPTTHHALQIDPSGNIVVGGQTGAINSNIDFVAIRFTQNGQIDTSFNGTGRAVFDFAGFDEICTGLAVQSDGSVVLSGRATFSPPDDRIDHGDFGVVRFNSDGTLDQGFGNGGSVTIDIGDHDMAQKVLIQNDPDCPNSPCEKIVITGGAVPYTLFARFLAD